MAIKFTCGYEYRIGALSRSQMMKCKIDEKRKTKIRVREPLC